jgi:hypothetical protein
VIDHSLADGVKPRSAAAELQPMSWLRAHVCTGRSYPLLAVRVCRRAPGSADAPEQIYPENKHLLETAAYAVALARKLDDAGMPATELDLDATLEVPESAVSIQLWISGDLPHLDDTKVVELARAVLVEHTGSGAWGLGDQVEFCVRLGPTIRAAQSFTAQGPLATSPQVSQEIEPAQPSSASVDSKSTPAGRLVALARRSLSPLAALGGVLAVLLVAAILSTAAPTVEVAPTPLDPTPEAVAVPADVPSEVSLEPVPEETPTVEASPPVVVAAIPAVPVNAAQPRLLDFAPDNGSNLFWPSNPQSVAWFAADGYHLAVRRPGQFVALGILPGHDLRDVLVTATFRKTGGPTGGGYGIILRDHDADPRDGLNQRGSYIVFEVGDKGEIGVWRREQDLWAEILGWTPSSAAHPGSGENDLAVRALGNRLTFTVNGTDIAVQTDSQPASGGVGVFLGGDANEAVLARLTVTPLN